jgi:peptidoglycan-associated lipoprotein
MLQKLVVGLLTLLLLAFFSGCAKKPVVQPETKPTETKKETTEQETPKSSDEEGVETDKGSRFVTIYFDTDKSNIRDDSRSGLETNANMLREFPSIKIMIEGHCDERNTDEYNLALGDRRARAARDFIISMGISADRIQMISYGEERPKALGHDESSWWQNRRCEFVITSE